MTAVPTQRSKSNFVRKARIFYEKEDSIINIDLCYVDYAYAKRL